MMWPRRELERQRLVRELTAAHARSGFRGLADPVMVDTLSWQFIASLRREDYYRAIQTRSLTAARTDPNSASFDAERAVAFHMRRGDIDEAGWLIFLMTHFARRPDTGWRRLQDVYGGLGTKTWDWVSVRGNPKAFTDWLAANWRQVGGAFGNHRKYESLNPAAKRPMARAVTEYLAWIGGAGHRQFFANAIRAAGNDPHVIFDYLYRSMKVNSFGRLAKFDYLSLISRYGLAPIEAGSAYLNGATGPGRGARLLVDGNPTSRTNNAALQVALDALDRRLGVGMEVMEDALCNWQKSPRRFIHYKG